MVICFVISLVCFFGLSRWFASLVSGLHLLPWNELEVSEFKVSACGHQSEVKPLARVIRLKLGECSQEPLDEIRTSDLQMVVSHFGVTTISVAGAAKQSVPRDYREPLRSPAKLPPPARHASLAPRERDSSVVGREWTRFATLLASPLVWLHRFAPT